MLIFVWPTTKKYVKTNCQDVNFTVQSFHGDLGMAHAHRTPYQAIRGPRTFIGNMLTVLFGTVAVIIINAHTITYSTAFKWHDLEDATQKGFNPRFGLFGGQEVRQGNPLLNLGPDSGDVKDPRSVRSRHIQFTRWMITCLSGINSSLATYLT